MSELIVVGFEGTRRGSEVLGQLFDLNLKGAIDLEDAVAVYRTKDGKLRVDESVQPTSEEGAAWGGLLGAMIGGLIMAPFTAGASAAGAAAAVGAGALTFGATGAVIGSEDALYMKDRYGISEDFVKQVGGLVQPGNSAVFVLADSQRPEEVTDYFKGYGGKILRTKLPPEKAQRLQQAMAASSARPQASAPPS